MHRVLDSLLRLLAPLMPHTADEAYRELTGEPNACIHYETFATLPQPIISPDWPVAIEARDAALKKLEEAKERGIENRLDAGVILPDPNQKLAPFLGDFPDMLGVSRVSLGVDLEEPQVQDLREEPRCDRSWLRDGTVKLREDGGMLTDRDAEAVGVGVAE
jgi:isoleucyl-tRNA synthetase